jgi:hypothetical protein
MCELEERRMETDGAWAAGPATTRPAKSGAATSGDQVTITNKGRRYVIGHGADFYGVWSRERRGAPVASFPRTEEGWQGAWLHFTTLEGNTPRRSRRGRVGGAP